MNSSVLLISGPAGSGKSTVADAWAHASKQPCAHLQLDDFRQLLKSGYIDPRSGWNDQAQDQLDLARENVSSVAKKFLRENCDVVIDDVAFPNWEASGLDRWKKSLAPLDVQLIVLFPEWETVRQRNTERPAGDRLPEKMLRTIYDDMAGWRDRAGLIVIDNSNLSREETVAEIGRRLST